MENDFGVVGKALDWLKSYLSSRKQQVTVKQCLSKEFNLHCGVPQGSCLGPILFLFYISRLYDIIEKHLPNCHGYADDTQLYMSFRPGTNDSEQAAVRALEACIHDVRSWMINNRLMINDSKTEFLLVGTQFQLKKVNIDSIEVGNSTVMPVSSVRNLGSYFDKHMSMDTHISKVCSKAFCGLYHIRKIRKFLDEKSTLTLVHAFVTSHVDYCNALLYGLPKYQYGRLQKILNAAARVVCSIAKFDHITLTLYKLHWLPVEQRIEFKILLMVYKALHGKSPLYIADFIQFDRNSNYDLRSNASQNLVCPETSRKTLGDRAFAHSGPYLWNKLPGHIKNSKSLDTFKQRLKTHLFKIGYA